MKIRPVGVQFVPCGQAGGRTGMAKLKVALRNSANAPKNQKTWFSPTKQPRNHKQDFDRLLKTQNRR
jgi:hypothetical protein